VYRIASRAENSAARARFSCGVTSNPRTARLTQAEKIRTTFPDPRERCQVADIGAACIVAVPQETCHQHLAVKDLYKPSASPIR
jgi:hypothetical protein